MLYFSNRGSVSLLSVVTLQVWWPQIHGSIPSRNKRFFNSSKPAARSWGPPTILFKGYWEALSPRIKQSQHDAHYSPQPSTQVKNEWCYTSTPHHPFIACHINICHTVHHHILYSHQHEHLISHSIYHH